MTLAILLFLATGLGWLYLLQVYAPGLRAEARTIPARVEAELSSHDAPYTPLTAISPNLQHAIIAIEDRRFYAHPGVDPVGLVRALWVNVTSQHIDQGGSTLEEQLAKRMIVSDDRSLHAKLRTMGIAWAIDQEFRKARVLELYLNAAYYGQGAYGASQASRIYFGVTPDQLTVAQAAFLAALPQAPSVYGAHPSSPVVQYRWRQVLQAMARAGYITPQVEQQAESSPLRFAIPNP
jgi:penicillin-binding protein 1A